MRHACVLISYPALVEKAPPQLALAAYFQQEDAAVVLYREWAAHRENQLYYSHRDSWDRMLQSGVQLLERFAQDDRVRIYRIPTRFYFGAFRGKG